MLDFVVVGIKVAINPKRGKATLLDELTKIAMNTSFPIVTA